MSSPMAVPVRTMHRIVGDATIAAFIVTGIYLKLQGPELFETNEMVRFIYRANHVYILNEPGQASPQRPLTSAGVMLLFLAILCHVPARK